jgi:hypothetical protein
MAPRVKIWLVILFATVRWATTVLFVRMTLMNASQNHAQLEALALTDWDPLLVCVHLALLDRLATLQSIPNSA